MEWLKKIDPNIIVYLIITGIVLFVLINLNVIRIGGNNENDVIEQYITDKQLDSLYHVIEKNNSNIEIYNNKIKDLNKTVNKIDHKISSNRKELASINKKYEKRITDINSYTSNELYQYLAKRYTP